MVKIEDVKLIKVRVGVRYWEDSEYNGVEDVSLFDATEPITPNMPFAVHSGRDNWKDYEWIIKINPLNGKIVGWKGRVIRQTFIINHVMTIPFIYWVIMMPF